MLPPPRARLEQPRTVDRLREIVRAPRGQALLPIPRHRVGGEFLMCRAGDVPAYDITSAQMDALQEPVHADDTFCDMCLRRIYDGSLRAERQGGSVAFVCGPCRDRAAGRYAAMTGDAA